jgi:putative methyltransferase (TIGR04325 family)
VKEAIKSAPIIKNILAKRYERKFKHASKTNLFYGVFSDFDEAERNAPRTKPLGYNNQSSAAMYRERMAGPMASDYPVIFWLRMILDQNPAVSIFDYGGHVGVSYYAYRKHLHYHPSMKWWVFDLEEVIQRGRQLQADETRAVHLHFTTDLSAANDSAIFLASGSLQYIKSPLHEQIGALKRFPEHLIINKVPLVSADGFVTLNNIGTAICPYQILSKPELISSLSELGYELVDSWENPDLVCEIPYPMTQALPKYFGFYFQRCPNPIVGASALGCGFEENIR